MSIQSEQIAKEAKSLFAGVDVGAEELMLIVRKNGISHQKVQKFANTPADRARLVKKMANMPGIIVCLEATGTGWRATRLNLKCQNCSFFPPAQWMPNVQIEGLADYKAWPEPRKFNNRRPQRERLSASPSRMQS